jgi:hypothetical protein
MGIEIQNVGEELDGEQGLVSVPLGAPGKVVAHKPERNGGQKRKGGGRGRDKLRSGSVSVAQEAQPAKQPLRETDVSLLQETGSSQPSASTADTGYASDWVVDQGDDGETIVTTSSAQVRKYSAEQVNLLEAALEQEKRGYISGKSRIQATQEVTVREPVRSQSLTRERSMRYAEFPATNQQEGVQESASVVPTIQVTIGRIEVRATPPPASSRPSQHQPAGPSVMSLDDYLDQRAKGGQ